MPPFIIVMFIADSILSAYYATKNPSRMRGIYDY